jgi:hypothetical protein
VGKPLPWQNMPLNLTEVLVDILNYYAHIIKETIKFSQMPNQHLLWGEIQTDSSHSIFLQNFFVTSQPLFCWMALCSKLTLPTHGLYIVPWPTSIYGTTLVLNSPK